MVMKALYESALRRAQIHRVGDITEIVFDGAGAVATATLDYKTAERWAMARMPSGNMIRDRGSFLERLETCIVRRGTSVTSTHGSSKPLVDLAKTMKKAGLNLSEWALPPEVKDALDGGGNEADEPDEAEAAAESAPDSPPVGTTASFDDKRAQRKRRRNRMDDLLKRST